MDDGRRVAGLGPGHRCSGGGSILGPLSDGNGATFCKGSNRPAVSNELTRALATLLDRAGTRLASLVWSPATTLLVEPLPDMGADSGSWCKRNAPVPLTVVCSDRAGLGRTQLHSALSTPLGCCCESLNGVYGGGVGGKLK